MTAAQAWNLEGVGLWGSQGREGRREDAEFRDLHSHTGSAQIQWKLDALERAEVHL